ncbi:MAG: TolC family outer membrane protein [Paracoccaceae bacterium]
MRKFWAVLSVAMLGFTPAAQSETLADALIAAYRNSNLLDQNQAVLRAADEDVAIAVSSLRPVVQYTLQSGWNRQESTFGRNTPWDTSLDTSLNLTASLTIADFGRTRLGIEIAEASVLATRQALVDVEQSVLLDAVSAYVEVGYQSSIVALRQSNVRLITEELRAATDRFDVGEVTRTDVALAEAALAAARSGLASARGDLALARESYRAATGAYPGRLSGLPRAPATARSLDEAREIALRTHPGIRQSQQEVKIGDLQVQLAKAQMSPTLSGSVSATERWEGNDEGIDGQSVTLSFNQTVYAGGRLSAGYRQAIQQKEQARAALQQAGVTVAENVGRSWSNIAVARASIAAGDEQIRAAQVAFDGVREEAALGARTTLDVLDAEQDLLDARASRLLAEANLYIGVYQLLSSMGLLTAEHLNLGIPTYDVGAYYKAVRNAPAHSPQGKKLDRILKSIGN